MFCAEDEFHNNAFVTYSVIPEREIVWDDQQYTWTEDNSSVRGSAFSTNLTNKIETYETVTPQIASDSDGGIAYIASFENPLFTTQYKTVDSNGNAEQPVAPIIGQDVEGAFSTGEISGDAVISADDLTLLARSVAKIEELTGDAAAAADVTGDGVVDANDLTMLARYVAKIISSFDEIEAQEPQPQEPVIIETGTFADTSDVYDLLNSFRTSPENQWYWNSDNTTKTYVTGLGTIARDEELEEVAKIRAKEAWIQYYENGIATHDRLDGSRCFTAYPDSLSAKGENLAWGQRSGEGAINGWAETNEPYDYQGHRRNMLSTKYNSVGIGCYEKDGKICWSMCLGRR